MRRRRRIPVHIDDGRFFVDVRIGMISSERRFSESIRALIDTGAQVTVLPLSIFQTLEYGGIDLRSTRLQGATTITTSAGRILADQYRGQIGLDLGRSTVLLAEDPTIFAVPRANDTNRDAENPRKPYIILGKDALATFSSRIRARYWVSSGGLHAPDTQHMKCSMTARGRRHARL